MGSEKTIGVFLLGVVLRGKCHGEEEVESVGVKGGPAMNPGRPTPTMKGAVLLSNTAHSVCTGHETRTVESACRKYATQL